MAGPAPTRNVPFPFLVRREDYPAVGPLRSRIERWTVNPLPDIDRVHWSDALADWARICASNSFEQLNHTHGVCVVKVIAKVYFPQPIMRHNGAVHLGNRTVRLATLTFPVVRGDAADLPAIGPGWYDAMGVAFRQALTVQIATWPSAIGDEDYELGFFDRADYECIYMVPPADPARSAQWRADQVADFRHRWGQQQLRAAQYEHRVMQRGGLAPPMAAGCAKGKKDTFREDPFGLRFKISCPQTSNNNCGYAVFVRAWNQLKGNAQNQLSLKRDLVLLMEAAGAERGDKLSIKHMENLANFYNVSLRVYTLALELVHEFIIAGGNSLIELYVEDEHYYNLNRKHHPSHCTDCGKVLRKDHRCSLSPVLVEGAEEVEVREGYVEPSVDWLALKTAAERSQVVLLSGPGGTGKSFLTKKFVEEQRGRGLQVVVCAPTGLAAINVGGKTMQRVFCQSKQTDAERLVAARCLKSELAQASWLVIDEISMVGACFFQRMNAILQLMKKNCLPFGGLKMLLVGDTSQLPPINDHFFFTTAVWHELEASGKLSVVQLKTPRRYADVRWFELLARCRVGKLNKEDIALLQSRVVERPPPDILHLYAVNKACHDQNELRLKTLPGNMLELKSVDVYKVPSYVAGQGNRHTVAPWDAKRILEKEMPEILKVKIGCQVLLLANQKEDRELVNGSHGTLIAVDDLCVRVAFDNGTTADVLREEVRVDGHTRAQFPIAVAYAYTMHKVQGMSLDKLYMALNSAIFCPNMAYVALSRLRTLEGLYLAPRPIWSKIYTLEESLKFELNSRNIKAAPLENLEPGDNDVLTCKTSRIGNSLNDKLLYFDLETLPVGKNRQLQVYYGSATYWEHGQRMDEFRSHKLDNGAALYDWIMAKIDADCDAFVRCKDDNSKSVEAKKRAKWFKKPIVLMAYNGGKFDMHFLLQHLMRRYKEDPLHHSRQQYSHNLIMKGSDLIMMHTIDHRSGKLALQVHDLFHFLVPLGLDSAHKTFCPKSTLHKGTFPHEAVARLGAECTFSRDLAVLITDFPDPKHPDLEGIDLQHYNILEQLDNYGMNDVYVLEELYAGLEKLVDGLLGQSVLRFITSTSIGHYGFMQHLPAECIGGTDSRQRQNKVVSKIYRHPADEESFCRKAIVGGKVFPRAQAWSSSGEPDDFLAYLDMSGMYVSCMKENLYPYGKPHWADEAELQHILQLCQEKQPLPWCIAEVDCQLHPWEVEPCVGFRNADNKTEWDTHRRVCNYTNIAIEELLRDEGTVFEVKRALVWPSACKIFEKWMLKTLKIKNEGTAEGDKGKRTLGKLWGNVTYGDCLKKDVHTELLLGDSAQELEEWLLDHEVRDFYPRSDGHGYFIGGDRLDTVDRARSSRPTYLGAFVLDYSKRALNRVYDQVNPWRRVPATGVLAQPVYGDTDSLLCHSSCLSRLVRAGQVGDANGLMVDDLNNDGPRKFDHRFDGSDWRTLELAKITDIVCPGPKAYGFVYTLHDKEQQQCKIKGVPKKGVAFTQGAQPSESFLTFDLMKRAVAARGSEEPVVASKAGVFKKYSYRLESTAIAAGLDQFDLAATDLQRTLFKTQWTGRKRYRDTQWLVPLHYPDEQVAENCIESPSKKRRLE